jgi:hypothetical protein
MKLKKQEFLALKQVAMSASEYQNKFIQLSCYTPADVGDDAEKQDHFRDGLIGSIKYQLMVHTFENFQKMVDNANMVEHARKEMGEQKRKFESSGQFSNNSRPRFVPPARNAFSHWRTGCQLWAESVPAPQPTEPAVAASLACWSISAASQLFAELLEHLCWNTYEEQYPYSH